MKNLTPHIISIDAIHQDGEYIAIGDNNRLYSASYSTQHQTMFYAIPNTVKVSQFVPLAAMPVLTYENVEEGNVYRFNDSWIIIEKVYGPFAKRPWRTVYANIRGTVPQVIKLYPHKTLS